MATNPVTSENPNIDFSTLKNTKDFTVVYHRDTDILVIRPIKSRPVTLVDWNGELWIRVDPITGEVLGLEVEDFASVFLKKHPDIKSAWCEVMSERHFFRTLGMRNTKKQEEISSESLLRIVFSFFTSFFSNNPCQVSLSI